MFNMDNMAPLEAPTEGEELIMNETKATSAYIHGEAERLAGFDIPIFLSGDIQQLDLPLDEQDILMILPSGEYKMNAIYVHHRYLEDRYHLILS